MLLLKTLLLHPCVFCLLLSYRSFLLKPHSLLTLLLFLDHFVHLHLHFLAFLLSPSLGLLPLSGKFLFILLLFLSALSFQHLLGCQLLLLLQLGRLCLVFTHILLMQVLQEGQFLLKTMDCDTERHQVTIYINGFLGLFLLLEGVPKSQISVHVLPIVLNGAF